MYENTTTTKKENTTTMNRTKIKFNMKEKKNRFIFVSGVVFYYSTYRTTD